MFVCAAAAWADDVRMNRRPGAGGLWGTLGSTGWRRCTSTGTAAWTSLWSPSTSCSPSGPAASPCSPSGCRKHSYSFCNLLLLMHSFCSSRWSLESHLFPFKKSFFFLFKLDLPVLRNKLFKIGTSDLINARRCSLDVRKKMKDAQISDIQCQAAFFLFYDTWEVM